MTEFVIGTRAHALNFEQFSPGRLMEIAAGYGAILKGRSDFTVLVKLETEDAERLRQDHPELIVEENLPYEIQSSAQVH